MTDDTRSRDDGDDARPPEDDASLVARVRAGDPAAFSELYDRWFDRVFDLGYRILWNSDAAADVARASFVTAWTHIDGLDDPRVFGPWLLRITRTAALERQGTEQHARPVDAEQLTMRERSAPPVEDRVAALDDPTRVMEDASYVALLWDAAEALGERDREALDLHLRHGLTPTEVADVVGVDRAAADQLVQRVGMRLEHAVGARVLWRGGQPACPSLRVELVANDVERFDADAARVIDRHAAGCDECTTRKQLQVSATQMFAAIPILGMTALKSRTAHALAAAGVPMAGLAGLPPDDTTTPPPGDRGDRRRRQVLVAVAGAALILVVFLAIVARGLGDDSKNVVAVASTTSTTRKPKTTSSTRSTSTSTSTTTSSSTTTTTTVPVIAPITTPPTAPPTTPPPTVPPSKPVSVQFTLQPEQVTQGYPKTTADGPVLDWSVRGADRVHLYDDAGVLDSEKATGHEVACPDAGTDATCNAAPGTYVYTLDAFNERNERVLHRTLELTIAP